ncbi:MAG TPA: DNA polymerase III subunit delta [Candidatus Dormibacteraeota bacterium]|nr:DNA polymerase III subunit delta [Candidatus Dormibacteraeota bacterium]
MSDVQPPAELLLIHGTERHLVDVAAHAWVEAARQLCVSDLNVEVIEAPSKLDQVRRSIAEVPFLDARRYIVVRDPPQLAERARRGTDSADALAAALSDRAPTTSLCLVTHVRVPPAHPVLIAVQRLGGRITLHQPLRRPELREWLDQRCAERRLRLPRAAVDHLLAVTGGDLGCLGNELDKLVAYSDGRAQIGVDEVRAVAAGDDQVEVWDVIDKLLTPPAARGAAAVEALLGEGVSTQNLISALANQFRELLRAGEILARGGRGSAALAAELGLPPWRAERLARRAARVDLDEVQGWLLALQRLDADTKLGKVDDADGLRSMMLRAALQLSPQPA